MPLIATVTANPALDIATSTAAVRPFDKLRCAEPRYDPGGGGINVARVVHALGGEAVALYPVGGSSGTMLDQLLDAVGVPRRAVPVAGGTRESFTVDERDTGKQFRFVLPGPKLSPAETDALYQALEDIPGDLAFVVVSGSLPPGLTPEFYNRVGAIARRRGARLVLDTSGEALRVAAGAGAYLIKPNLRELETLAGRPLPDAAAAAKAAQAVIAEGLAEAAAVSMGPQGALLVTGDSITRYPALTLKPLSTVGAGDSMLAGIVLALARGEPLVDAVRYGVACGAAALMMPGTQLAHPEDVARLLARLPQPEAMTL